MHKTRYNHNHKLNDNFTECCLNCSHSFRIIKTHILNFYKEIKEYSYSSLSCLPINELYRKYQLLDEITKLNGGDNLSRMVLTDTSIKSVLTYIREFYTSFFEIHEKHLANEIMLSPTPWGVLDSFELYPRYKSLIKNHLELLNLKPGERLVFIGCGPLPVSLIVLKKYFDIDSVGIDSDPNAVTLAKECLKKLDIKNGINIIHGDESVLEKLTANRIVLAAMAVPKKRIFKNLKTLSKIENDLKVIYRTYSGLRAILYPPIPSDYIDGFIKVDEIIHSGEINNTLVLLTSNNLKQLNHKERKVITK